MSKKTLKILTVIMLLVLLTCTFVFADTGDNTEYDNGTTYYDTDSGPSGGDADGILRMIFYLIVSELPLPLKLIVIAGLFIFYVFIKKGGKINKKEKVRVPIKPVVVDRVETRIKDYTEEIERGLQLTDENFNANKFLGWVEEVFMSIQVAWMERDWEKVRPFEDDNLFHKHQMQLQDYKDKHIINIMERININQSLLYEYKTDKEYEHMKVYMQVRMNDYVIDERTREVVKGDEDREYHMKYILTFTRKFGVMTDSQKSNMSTHKCPNCGAPLSMTISGKCEYCSVIITTGEHDWVLSDLDSIKADTVISGGGMR